MKIFLCETKFGLRKMTLEKIIKSKRKGNQVKVICVDSIKEKGYKNGNKG